MIGEPVASPRDLQRYERLLVEKRRELSSPLGEAQSRVPAAGGLEGDLLEYFFTLMARQLRKSIARNLQKLRHFLIDICSVRRRGQFLASQQL
jgi:hypothetical protein